MATYKADTVYSYKKGNGHTCGSHAHVTFTVQGQSESAVMAEIKKKHGDQAEIIIEKLTWK
jgi:hypothetical protein